ncbi:transposase [Streptomyces sp. SLBN-134]|uniref:transposase n=1 Tax=Streptomyces sp. SLBN-134 TaxID=2768456 RepID=UPI00114D725E
MGADRALAPDRTPKRGCRWRDHREVIGAVIFKFQTGTQWVHLPEKHGNWRGVYNRLRTWAIDGTELDSPRFANFAHWCGRWWTLSQPTLTPPRLPSPASAVPRHGGICTCALRLATPRAEHGASHKL